MTAQGVGIFTIEFPDPYFIEYYNDKFVTLGDNISFQYPITNNIQTLSTKNVERGNDPYGILFVPELETDGCKKSEEEYVPANATRLRNLPQGTNYALIAIAPWFEPTCMHEYFKSVRAAPVKALLVYQPGTSAAMPPPMNDASWGLGDGGGWKSSNNFPTYAIMSVSGSIITKQLSLYSGNITDAPNGHELSSMFSPTDYVRLWATVNTDSGSTLPSLWVFLVIVLGLLILVIVATSSFMHVIQRRRRNELRQRVINGEVNLEAVGVKRLTVPQDFLEKLPIYTYSGSTENREPEKALPQAPPNVHKTLSPNVDAETGSKSIPLTRRSSAPLATAHPNGTSPSFSQPTCPICLDDFEPNETQVRELPCRHIFHPDCVDTFLLSNSSLCPMCKASVLPSGYCPAKITNVMVRRERMIRRMRARSDMNANVPGTQPAPLVPRQHHGPLGSLGSRIGGAITGRRVFSAPARTQSRPPDIEMATPADPTPSSAPASGVTPRTASTQATADCPEQTTQSRREWTRQRAMNLLGNQQIPADGEEEETGPRWKRGLRRVFPGFR